MIVLYDMLGVPREVDEGFGKVQNGPYSLDYEIRSAEGGWKRSFCRCMECDEEYEVVYPCELEIEDLKCINCCSEFLVDAS